MTRPNRFRFGSFEARQIIVVRVIGATDKASTSWSGSLVEALFNTYQCGANRGGAQRVLATVPTTLPDVGQTWVDAGYCGQLIS